MTSSRPALSARTSRRLAVLAVAAGLAVTLSACAGSGTDTAGGASSPAATATVNGVATVHNDADVAFVNDMTPHHTGAITMAELAATRAGSRQVKDLAAKIAAAQAPEQQRMAAMATAWGVSAPATDAHMGMSDDAALAQLKGTAFDRQFLTQMIAHHQSALPMAQAELNDGRNPQAQQLAQSIIAAQTAEIAQMQQMLTTL